MRVAITGDDGFIAQHIQAALGDDAEIIPWDIIDDEMMLGAKLAACQALIHLNGHPPNLDMERDDNDVLELMRKGAKKVLDAVGKHQGMHLVLIGSLRVHPQTGPDDPYYSSETRLAPRDVTAEGQLWAEERALDHATDTHPVSVLRVANVQGIPLGDGEGHGIIHRFCYEANFGFFIVPGDGTQVKDIIHVKDLANVVLGIVSNPPPTREAIAVGRGEPVAMDKLVEAISENTGGAPNYSGSNTDEVWGVVDAVELEQRLGYKAQISLEDIVGEALQHASS